MIYIALSIGVLLFSLLLAIPATVQAGVFLDNPPGGQFKQECRSWDVYTMIISYSIFSSILFCFTFSFLFSLCILGSPLLRDVYDPDEHTQRWRLLLTLSLVNIVYIIAGFLLNFKEYSRFMYKCCALTTPLEGKHSVAHCYTMVKSTSPIFLHQNNLVISRDDKHSHVTLPLCWNVGVFIYICHSAV